MAAYIPMAVRVLYELLKQQEDKPYDAALYKKAIVLLASMPPPTDYSTEDQGEMVLWELAAASAESDAAVKEVLADYHSPVGLTGTRLLCAVGWKVPDIFLEESMGDDVTSAEWFALLECKAIPDFVSVPVPKVYTEDFPVFERMLTLPRVHIGYQDELDVDAHVPLEHIYAFMQTDHHPSLNPIVAANAMTGTEATVWLGFVGAKDIRYDLTLQRAVRDFYVKRGMVVLEDTADYRQRSRVACHWVYDSDSVPSLAVY